MQLLKVIDPRDSLEKATRDDLREYAERNGIKEIDWRMAGDQMRMILRKMGVKEIPLPNRILGQPYKAIIPEPGQYVPTQSIDEMQQQQWEHQIKDTDRGLQTRQELIDSGDPTVLEDQLNGKLESMARWELAKECKKRGIKMARTDTKEMLRERLSGQQNAT